jgi:hypothetical protein
MICSYSGGRLVGKPWVISLTLGALQRPLQPIENRTISDVPICIESAAFSAGR